MEKFCKLNKLPVNFVDKKIGILIGMNCPDIIKPLHTVTTSRNGLYATKHYFGWALNGPISGNFASKNCSFITEERHELDDLDRKKRDIWT